MLHHRIVDRIARRLRESIAIEAQEIEIALRFVERVAAGRDRRRLEPLELGEQQLHREEEDAAVPGIGRVGDIGFGAGTIGLLDESRDLERALGAGERLAALDIAIAGLGPARGDPEGDELAGLGRGGGTRDRGFERSGIGDRVIRRHHQHQRVGRSVSEL